MGRCLAQTGFRPPVRVAHLCRFFRQGPGRSFNELFLYFAPRDRRGIRSRRIDTVSGRTGQPESTDRCYAMPDPHARTERDAYRDRSSLDTAWLLRPVLASKSGDIQQGDRLMRLRVIFEP
jgi:hypothetical protein